ncbi:MAG: hypothetical protein WCF99_13620 [Chloroflexales bacterium]
MQIQAVILAENVAAARSVGTPADQIDRSPSVDGPVAAHTRTRDLLNGLLLPPSVRD